MSKLSVTELSNTIAQAIRDGVKKQVTVVGEVSNPKVKGNNTFLTLKDNKSSIEVKFWQKQVKDTEAKHGDNVEITGKIDYYAPYGTMSLIGTDIKRVGFGSINAQYEKTRKEYEKNGYFDNKKPMPISIKNIGVVTAETGAALQDFIRVLRNNKFNGNVFVYDALVQGPRCPDSVASGIRFFDSPFYVNVDNRINNNITDQISDNLKSKISDNKRVEKSIKKSIKNNISANPKKSTDLEDSDEESFDPFAVSDEEDMYESNIDENEYNENEYNENEYNENEYNENEYNENEYDETNLEELCDDFEQIEVDIIVITRGGGSFEDLMGFSHPTVLDAIYNSKRYTVSSVGHEIDAMLSDFVANCSVGTPSMAGDIISKTCYVGVEKLHEIEKTIMRYRQDIVSKLYAMRQKIISIQNNLEDPIKKIIKKIDDIEYESKDSIWRSLKRYAKKNRIIHERISQHDCTGLLKNGFSVLVGLDGKIIKDSASLFDQKIKLIHETGNYEVKIIRI
jgi:exonuclease VII large subunit